MAQTARCQCDVVDGYLWGHLEQECGSPATTVYHSSLPTPPIGTLWLEVSDTTCTVSVSIRQANGNVITRTISPTSQYTHLILTVGQIDTISVTCSGGTGLEPTCHVIWELQLHYCKCCYR